MSIDYIRKTYGLPVKVGMIVRIRKDASLAGNSLIGKVLRAKGEYVVVKGDTWQGYFDPADIECQIGVGATPPRP